MAGASGKKLDDTYKLAWIRGLKTTYYLRTVGATHAEKSTGRAGQMNAVSSGPSASSAAAQATADKASASSVSPLMAAALASQAQLSASPATDIKFCAIDDPGCEACQ
jgi:ribonucleoside-diphosphate reductase alpha chain